MGGAGFTPDPGRLYEVGQDGRPYTLDPEPPELAAARERRVQRWWVAAVLVNGASMGVTAAAIFFLPRSVAAWFGLLPLLSAPLFLVGPLLRRRSLLAPRRVHRRRPDRFPPPDLPAPPAM